MQGPATLAAPAPPCLLGCEAPKGTQPGRPPREVREGNKLGRIVTELEARGRGTGVWGQKAATATPGPEGLGGAKRPGARVSGVALLKIRARMFKPETTGAVERRRCWRDGGVEGSPEREEDAGSLPVGPG